MESNINQSQKFQTFVEGTTLIFKKWAGFRLSLDHNPDVLDEYVEDMEEDENDQPDELEINFLYKALLEDVWSEISKGALENQISSMLIDFLTENFDTYLEDQSEKLVALNMIKLYKEINENKTEFIDRLREVDKNFNYSVYAIKFPIEIIETTEVEKGIEKMIIEPDEDGFFEVKKGKKGF